MSEENISLESFEIEQFENSYIKPIYPILCKGIHYRTSIARFKKIISQGFIDPHQITLNAKFFHVATENSFCYQNEYVCLFDFESSTYRHHVLIQTTWTGFFVDFQPATIVLQLTRHGLQDKLIPNSEGEGFYIPFVEVWYPEKIPISSINSYLVVQLPPPFEKVVFRQFGTNEVEAMTEVLNYLEAHENFYFKDTD